MASLVAKEETCEITAKMETVTPETCAKVIEICQEHLGGPWVNARAEQIIIQRFKNGMNNRNYRAKLTEVSKAKVSMDVVVHLYGVEDGIESAVRFNGEKYEATILYELSAHGWVRKLCAVFDGGRIDEYVESSHPTFALLQSQPKLIEDIGQQLARIHSVEMPGSKEPNRVHHLLNMISKFENFELSAKHQEFKPVFEECLAFPLEEELKWFDSNSPKFGAEPVFCQNDMNLNNILVLKEPKSVDTKVMIIDFEASGYYYRGFDLAFFLTMRKLEFRNNTETLHHIDDHEVNTRERFLEAYLNEWESRGKKLDSSVDTLEHLRMEVDYFEIHSTLLSLAIMRDFLMNLDARPNLKLEFYEKWIHAEKAKYQKQKDAILETYSDYFKS